MSFTPNFTAQQSLGSPSVITFTDTSVGSDIAIVNRRITLLKSNGSNLYQASNWAISNISKSIDVLNRDYGLSVTVDWLDISNNVLYSKVYAMCFVAYSSIFLIELTQQETATPNIISDTPYWGNKAKLMTLIDDADNAVVMGNDYITAQTFLDQAYYLITNKNRFF